MAVITGLRDGRWYVGRAGAVTFAAEGEGLALGDVAAEPGWSPKVAREEPSHLAVGFRRGSEEWVFDVRYRDSVLAVELAHEQEEADPGRYQVGDAAEVEIAVAPDNRLELVEIHTNPGWSMEVTQQRQRKAEVEFSHGAFEWQFEAGLSKQGRLEVRIRMEVESSIRSEAS